MTGKDYFATGVLILMTVVLVIAVWPVFEVSLDDSWTFALPTLQLVQTGRAVFSPFTSATPVLHILWGGLVCEIAGFSFASCRIANILLTLITSIVVYFMFRQGGARERVAGVGAAAFAANPIVMVTSYTYQSDIAYLTCAFAAAAFYLRYCRSLRHRDLLAATLLASLSLWNKIHGVLLPAGALVFFVLAARTYHIRGARWLTITALPAASYVLFVWARQWIHPVRTALDLKTKEAIDRVLSLDVLVFDGGWRMFCMIVAIGLYSLPLIVGYLAWRKGEDSLSARSRWVLAVAWIAVIGAWREFAISLGEDYYPFHASMLLEPPSLLPDVPPFVPRLIMSMLSFLAWPAGAFVGYHLTASAIQAVKSRNQDLLLLGLLLPQMLILVPIGFFMDRYFLVLFPLAFLLIMRRFDQTRLRLVLSIVVIALSFVFGAARITQYRNGNVALWEAAGRLMKAGVPSLQIDAGYPWTGWHNYEYSLQHPEINNARMGDSWYIRQVCQATDVRYLVGFSPPAGDVDVLIRKIPYSEPFQKNPGFVYVYRRAFAEDVDLGD